MKNAVEKINRLDQAEERINEYEYRSFEIIQSEDKSEKSLQKLLVTIKWTNTHIMGVLEGDKTEKEAESLFKEIITWKLSKSGKWNGYPDSWRL